MTGWGIPDGSRIIINPAEKVCNMDIALICYHDNLALKKVRYMKDNSIDLLASDGTIIHIPTEEQIPELFKIWGKAMAEVSRIRHGI